MRRGRHRFAVILAGCALSGRSACARDGAHDFGFLLGNWTAHARQLPDRLNGSHDWIAFEGAEHHSRILRSSTDLEEFEVYDAERRIPGGRPVKDRQARGA